MDVIKSYPRQHHTQIALVDYKGDDRVYNGRLTEIVLYAAGGQMLAEVNMFANQSAEEPMCHEIVIVYGIRVTAVEEQFPEPAPAPPTELHEGYDDSEGGEA